VRNSPISRGYAIDIWLKISKLLWKKVRGWSINIEADLKRKKRDLIEEFDILDVFSKTNRTTEVDRIR